MKDTRQSNLGDADVLDFGDAGPSPPSTPIQTTIAFETHRVRIIVAIATLTIFLLLNGLVLYGVHEALQFDFKMLSAKPGAYERFITPTVISSILGATTIQLGAIMFAITKFFFPSK